MIDLDLVSHLVLAATTVGSIWRWSVWKKRAVEAQELAEYLEKARNSDRSGLLAELAPLRAFKAKFDAQRAKDAAAKRAKRRAS